MTDLAAEWADPASLVPWDRNPRRHPDSQIQALMTSIRELGFTTPIVARRSDRRVLAGHGRLEAARRLGLARVPVRFVELSDERCAALVVADNRLGELSDWDRTSLGDLLAEVAPMSGLFDAAELARLTRLPHELARDAATDADPCPGTTGAVFGLLADYRPPVTGAWQLPALREDRMLPAPDEPPMVATPMHPHPGGIAVAGNNAEKAASPGLIWCTYTEDPYFERFWEHPVDAFTRLLSYAPSGAIGWDFSTWGDDPFPKRLWALYRSYWCTRYAQECGIHVWPNVAWLLEDPVASVAPIPRGACVATQLHTASSERRAYVEGEEAALRALAPNAILAYAEEARRGFWLDLYRTICDRVIVIEPAYVIRRRDQQAKAKTRRQSNGDQAKGRRRQAEEQEGPAGRESDRGAGGGGGGGVTPIVDG